MSSRLGSSFLIALCGLVVGCGGPTYKLAKVAGQLTLDGKPVVGAKITFNPQGDKGIPEPGPMSFAVTDADGNFRLETMAGDRGAVVGSHNVMVTTLKTKPHPSNPGQVVEVEPERAPLRYRTAPGYRIAVPADGLPELKIGMLTGE